MAIDPRRITIISAKKVDQQKLIDIGDRSPSLPAAASEHSEKRCNVCCAAFGLVASLFTVLPLTAMLTASAIFHEKRVNYSVNGVCRQAMWLALPGLCVGMTLHYLLADTMWSRKRNTWSHAWIKALTCNTMLWGAGIALSTGIWRKVLPLSAWGRRLYHRYPIPSESLDVRVLRTEEELLTGMGATYWLSGIGSGQVSCAAIMMLCVYNDRPHMMMSPYGYYASNCLPPWRRDQLARY